MAITWLDNKALYKVIYYDASANSYTTRTITSNFDLFADDATAGDFIFFQALPAWKDLILTITTPLSATGLTVVWEYNTTQQGGWTTIPQLIDGTLNFTQSGRIVFDPPTNWRDFFSTTSIPGSTNGIPAIRCRITAITSITEGGQAGANPQCGNNCIYVDGYSSASPCRLSDIYSADLTGTRLLAPPMPCTTGMTITKIYGAEQGAQRLIFTLAGTSAGAGDTIDITGIGPEGETITESIDVSSGNGTYTSAYSYASNTTVTFNCNGWSDGTVKVEQGRWGNVWRLGYVGDYYNNPKLYMIDRSQFQVAPTGYFKMQYECLISHRSTFDRGFSIRFQKNTTIDTSTIVMDDRMAEYTGSNLGGFYLGDNNASPNISIVSSKLATTRDRGTGESWWYINNYDNTFTITDSYIGHPLARWSNPSIILPVFKNTVIDFAQLWYQNATQKMMDLGNSFLPGQLYLVYGWGDKIRNLTVEQVGHQYQQNNTFYLQDVVATNWPSSISGTGSEIWRMYSLQIKVIDEQGNPISGVSVSIKDINGDEIGYHTTTINNSYGSASNFIDVFDASKFSVGDSVKIKWRSSITKTISSINRGGGVGGSDRITFTSTLGAAVAGYDPVQRVGSLIETNSLGEIPTQYITYTVIGTSGTITYTPHIITLSKSGYITETLKINMDEPRKQVVVLKTENSLLLPMGKRVYQNLEPDNIHNIILWEEL